jgi:hypothetical protein
MRYSPSCRGILRSSGPPRSIAEFLHDHQGREQVADLVGQLGEAIGVLRHGGALALAVALGKLVGELAEQIGAGVSFGHGQGSMRPPGRAVRISLSRLRART